MRSLLARFSCGGQAVCLSPRSPARTKLIFVNANFITIGSKGVSIPTGLSEIRPPLVIGVNHLRWANPGKVLAAGEVTGGFQGTVNRSRFTLWSAQLTKAECNGFLERLGRCMGS